MLLLATTAIFAGRDIARAQTSDGSDLSIELVDPKVLRVCATRAICRSQTTRARGSRTSWVNCSRKNCRKSSTICIIRKRSALPDDARHATVATSSWVFRKAMIWSRAPILIIGRHTRWLPSRAAVSTRSGTLSDARLKGKHIGIVAGTPPATNMTVNGLMADAKSYPLMVDTRIDSSAEAMIKDLTSGKIDAAILWGPMAGFYANKKKLRSMSRRWSRKPRVRGSPSASAWASGRPTRTGSGCSIV